MTKNRANIGRKLSVGSEKSPFFIPSDNERRILGAILRAGGSSQPQLSRKTSLAQQSVSRLVNSLIAHGAIRENGRSSDGRRGQPSISVAIEPTFAYTFGVAMMTDALSLALMDFSGTVIEQQQFDMVTMTRASVIERLETLFTEFLEKHEIDESRLLGIGVGISGYSLGTHGRYNTPRTLDDWALVDIEELLQEQFGHPVWVENDGNAAAIGESLVGAGRSYNNFGYVFFSTGIGGGIVYEHELMRGTNGNAGELGLLLPRAVYPHPNLELLRNIVAQSGIEVTGISDLLNKFDPDWPAVDEWIARSRDSLSLIASSLAAILDPEAIVMGGRIPKSLARKVIPHIEIFNDARRSEPRQVPRLMVSETEGDACAIGAAALPFNGCYFKIS